MADDDSDEDIVLSENKAPLSTVKLLIITLLVSLFMSGAVGAGLFFMLKSELAAQLKGEEEVVEVEEEVVEEEVEEEPPKPAIYFPLGKDFTVNLAAKKTRFLQVRVELMARDEAVVEAVERHRPLLRNNVLMLLSRQTPESISSPEGKESLRQATLAEVRTALEGQGEPAEVEDLYFTTMVIQ